MPTLTEKIDCRETVTDERPSVTIHYIPDADVNKAAYFALTGKVNNAPFKGLAAGECLFLGPAARSAARTTGKSPSASRPAPTRPA